MFFATEVFRASAGPMSANKFPPRVKNTAVENTSVASPNFLRASRRHRNRLYRSLHAKVAARRKVHKISGHTRRNVNISWFRVTRTPEDVPNTPEDAPVVFSSTFRELPGATGIASIGACMQKLRLAEKYIKYQDTRDEM